MDEILSLSVRFCRLYIKKHFGVFFSGSQCMNNLQSFSDMLAVLLVSAGRRAIGG